MLNWRTKRERERDLHPSTKRHERAKPISTPRGARAGWDPRSSSLKSSPHFRRQRDALEALEWACDGAGRCGQTTLSIRLQSQFIMAKVAVITGCSSGLGRAVAVELAGQLQKDLKPAYKIYAAARK